MRSLTLLVGLLIGLACPAFADVFGVPPPFLRPLATSVNATTLTISCPGTGATSSTITCTGTYTGTAPATTGWTYSWNSTCTGSGSVTSVGTPSGGSIPSIVVPTPTGACAGTLTLTTNIPTSATSGSVTISGATWVLLAHTQGTGGTSNGVTTSAINCSGANLIIFHVAFYTAGGGISSVTDSSSNSWGAPQTNSGGTSGVAVYIVINPTTSSSQTFTVAGSGFFPTTSVECWHDTIGTPVLDNLIANSTATTVATITAGVSAYTPAVSNELLITPMGINTAPGLTYAIDTGFTISDQGQAASGVNVSGALAYFIDPNTSPINPTWTLTPPGVNGAATFIAGFKP